MSCCDLWPVDLENLWYIEHHVFKVCAKFERNRTLSGWVIDDLANFCPRYVRLLPWPITHWPWTRVVQRVSCGYTMYEQNRSVRGSVIDKDLAIFLQLPWPLASWPLTFAVDWMSHVQTLYTIWAKSNNPRLSYWRFSIFFSGSILPNSTPQRGMSQTGPNLGEQSSRHRCIKWNTSVAMCCIVSTRGRLKKEKCRRSRPNFTPFDPL